MNTQANPRNEDRMNQNEHEDGTTATPGQPAGIEVTHDPEIPVHLVQLWLCDLCLDGAGGECHVPGCALWINRAPDVALHGNPMVTILDVSLDLPASEVPAAALALYEAAGLPVPVILPRAMPPLGGPWRPHEGAALRATHVRAGNAPGEERVGWGGAGPYKDMTPAKAREMAAALAALADQAEAEPEPGPDAVTELATEIHRAQCNTSPDPCDGCREVARLVLLGGWKREPGQ